MNVIFQKFQAKESRVTQPPSPAADVMVRLRQLITSSKKKKNHMSSSIKTRPIKTQRRSADGKASLCVNPHPVFNGHRAFMATRWTFNTEGYLWCTVSVSLYLEMIWKWFKLPSRCNCCYLFRSLPSCLWIFIPSEKLWTWLLCSWIQTWDEAVISSRVPSDYFYETGGASYLYRSAIV